MKPDRLDLRGLGYVGIAAADPKAWSEFAREVCGLVPARFVPGSRQNGTLPASPEADGMSEDGSAFLKMDERQWRIAVHPLAESEAEGLRYLGLELGGATAFERAVAQLEAAGVALEAGSEQERAARCVDHLAILRDPAGHRVELFSNPLVDERFQSPAGLSFLTGELGMGHVVLYVPDLPAALAFYREVLGFERSDYMHFGPNGMGIHFLRCTRRHHSIALLHIGAHSGLQHLMLETTELDGVGSALDRAIARGVSITSNLGRHINDNTVSFYMKGPSGFDVEIGWDGLLIDEDWVEHEFTGTGDLWGHHGLDADALRPKS